MTTSSTSDVPWATISPRLHLPRSRRTLAEFVRQLAHAVSDEDKVDRILVDFLEDAGLWPVEDRLRISAMARVLADIARQGWALRVRKEVISVRPPSEISADPLAEKQRVRRQEQLKRDEQLLQQPVQAFIRSMERKQLYKGRFVSVFSLMRDGRELAAALKAARDSTADESNALRSVISPYIQFVTGETKCEFTGLSLQDIWRYFRHTWSNQYVSVPGRTMMLLVRDAAVEFHPIIGICALSSPILQIRERDEWIGWHPASFLEEITARPTARIAKWLVEIVDDALTDIYVDDLVSEQVVTLKTLRTPTDATFVALQGEGVKRRELHHRYVKAQELKQTRASSDGSHWQDRAESNLFRSKRALMLADLLHARRTLQKHLGQKPSAKTLATLLANSEGLHVVKRILRKAKGDRVGISMADISVCGAVAPYNPILGGKLVSMLATSPEVVVAYRERYATAESEIASAVAGRPIVRPPKLVFLGTTSLYGSGASQYNRIKIPCDALGGTAGEAIEYVRLGMSESFGTSQYSDETLDDLVLLVNQESQGQRVNHIFGEGQSPKLRKVREGLELLGLRSELFLRHGRRRILYGITLVRNTRDYLLGLDGQPDYLVPKKSWSDASRNIISFWRKRWLQPRIASDEVLLDVARHTLVHPITHGGRVALPTPRNSPQSMLQFEPSESFAG